MDNQIDQDGNRILQDDLIHFQQDGALPHYFPSVGQGLNNRFTGSWISRRGAIVGQLRSRLTTPGFISWGPLNLFGYKTASRYGIFEEMNIS